MGLTREWTCAQVQVWTARTDGPLLPGSEANYQLCRTSLMAKTPIQAGVEPGMDLEETLRVLRSQELHAAEVATKRRMVEIGRCPICTLAVPCRHYQTRSELPTSNAAYERREGSDGFVHTLESPGRGGDLGTVRIRGSGGVVVKKRSHSQNESRKAELRRVKLMERLDRYREERLRKEIAKIEEMKRKEENEYRETIARDQRRRLRDLQLKKQLTVYQERRLREQQEKQSQFLETSQRSQSIARRIHQHAMKQKQLLRSYRQKAQIIESIEREQVAELGNCKTESQVLEPRE